MRSHFTSYPGCTYCIQQKKTKIHNAHNGAALHISCTVDTMPANALAPLGARASTGMVLTK